MLPEVQVLLQRACSARLLLDGLLDALPPDYWTRVAAGSRWTVRDQLAHVTSADDLLVDLLLRVLDGEQVAWVASTQDPTELLVQREAPVSRMAAIALKELRDAAAESRDAVEATCVRLDATTLEAGVFVAGAVDRWGAPVRWGLREYLASWAAHDSAHEFDIRAAIATPPDLSTVALTQRRRN